MGCCVAAVRPDDNVGRVSRERIRPLAGIFLVVDGGCDRVCDCAVDVVVAAAEGVHRRTVNGRRSKMGRMGEPHRVRAGILEGIGWRRARSVVQLAGNGVQNIRLDEARLLSEHGDFGVTLIERRPKDILAFFLFYIPPSMAFGRVA